MLDLLNHWEKNGNTVCEFFLKFVSLLPFLTVIRWHAEYITHCEPVEQIKSKWSVKYIYS